MSGGRIAAVALERVTLPLSRQRSAGVFDVTLDIAPGELVVCIGPSGCGKTTLLRLIAGFLAPDAGAIRLERRRRERAADARRANAASCSRPTRCFRTCASGRTSRIRCACATFRSTSGGGARGAMLELVGLARVRRSPAGGALRRPAAARRAGARAGVQAARAAARRAAVGARRRDADRRCATRSGASSASRTSPRCSSRTTRTKRCRSPIAWS